MKVSLDTNVVVRLLVVDDERQATAARALLEDADRIVISTIVLCETAWVLARTYRFSSNELAGALRRFINLPGLELDRPAAEAGLQMLEAGGDFADGCTLFEARRSRCDQLATFDKVFAGLSDGFASRPGEA